MVSLLYRKLLGGPLSVVLVAVLCAGCGGGTAASGGADSPESSGGNGEEDADSDMSNASAGAAEAAPPASCQGEGCFECGSGFCLTGYYCAKSAPGGPACSWLPECPAEPSCACVEAALGSGCSCEQQGGGLFVECK